MGREGWGGCIFCYFYFLLFQEICTIRRIKKKIEKKLVATISCIRKTDRTNLNMYFAAKREQILSGGRGLETVTMKETFSYQKQALAWTRQFFGWGLVGHASCSCLMCGPDSGYKRKINQWGYQLILI